MRRLSKGDLVVVTRGNHKGERGKVARVMIERDAVVVEGVNRVKRHVKPSGERPGGIVSREAPIHQSKLMLIDPETDKPTRVSHRIEDGKKVRVTKSGAKIQVVR